MAHLLQQQTAIFSPSVARAAASTAKDWAYIDGWLRAKYQGRPVPAFERNPDTLKALLALASHNEAADEERDQLARLEAAALDEVRASEAGKVRRREESRSPPAGGGGGDGDQRLPLLDGELVADDILRAIESRLTREGTAALDAMAAMAVELGMAYPTPETLGCRFAELQGKALELDQAIERVAALEKFLETESATTAKLVEDLQGDEFRSAEDLARQNLETQRHIKLLSSKVPDFQQQLAVLERSAGTPGLTVEEVRKDEEDYLELLAKKKDLDEQVKAFAGLPPDLEAARLELEALRAELRDATGRRDAAFEGLVERESPAKPRRRP